MSGGVRNLHPIDCHQLTADVEATYDAVIVGSGAGGAVLAKELAEGGMKVAILEEGAYHRTHRDLAVEAIQRLYRDKGLSSTLGNPIIPVAMGKCFGGTTVINSGTCFRTPDPVFQTWREKRRLTDLDAGEFDRAFTRVEREINVEPADFAVMSRTNTLMHELLAAQGFRGAAIRRNIRGCEGCGMCCYGCESGAKQSMDVSYLPKAMAAGTIAYTHARAAEILTDPATGAARGVIADAVDRHSRKTGRTVTLYADKVILAAGTFFSPQILRANRLARGNRHVGRHLTLHPATKLYAEFEEDIRGWEGTPQAYYLDALHGEGIMFEGIFTPPDLAGMTFPGVGPKMIEFMKRFSHMTTFGMMIGDESEGRLVWLPLFGNSFIYSLTPGDVKKIQKGVAFLARVFLRGGAKRVIPLVRNREFKTLEEVDRFEKSPLKAGDIDCMAFHPLGTCRMGATAADGVCGQDNQVFGTPGLYICDGSVVPTSLGVNPQLTIMAFATRLAGRMLGKSLS